MLQGLDSALASGAGQHSMQIQCTAVYVLKDQGEHVSAEVCQTCSRVCMAMQIKCGWTFSHKQTEKQEANNTNSQKKPSNRSDLIYYMASKLRACARRDLLQGLNSATCTCTV